jgi:hypothetical protein
LVSRCDLPGGATFEDGRDGGLVYVDSGLMRRLRVSAAAPGRLHWSVDVGDEMLSQPDSTAFRTTYAIDDALVGGEDRRVDSRNWIGYPWPTTGVGLDKDLVGDVRRFAPLMLWFLRDRRELGLMLLRGDETPASSAERREGVEGRRWSGGAASLVHAVILARHMGDPGLERFAFDKLRRHRDQHVEGLNGTVAQAVARWAKDAERWAPVDVRDLIP